MTSADVKLQMDESKNISVRVLSGGRRAELFIPAAFEPTQVNSALLRTLAAGSGVQVTAEVERRFSAICADYAATPRELCVSIADATEPVDGAGAVWNWEKGMDPSGALPVQAMDGQRADLYAARVASVAAGAVVARVALATSGTDGLSVTGKVIPARAGPAARLRPGDGLAVSLDGAVVAQRDGVLRVSAGVVTVSTVLEIKGSVDFSTGRIDFRGDVVVADAIRDGFEVRATGSVTVHGPVEAATIECGGDLACPRGIASAQRATLTVGGHSTIEFLRNATAVFKGDLDCRGELAHSDVTVGGELRCESGRIIGGKLSIASIARIGTVGSPEWLPTTVSVGVLPTLALELQSLSIDAARAHKALGVKEDSLRQLQTCGGKQSASMRERLTELQFELSELRREAAEIEKKRTPLLLAVLHGQQAELHVARSIYPRVRIQHANTAFEIEKELKGPLQLSISSTGTIMVRISTQPPRPITDFARSVSPPEPEALRPVRKSA